MGTINYKTSDYITVGYNCNFIDHDDEYSYEIVSDYYEQTAHALKNESFYYFHVTLEPGYYEGFSINIEYNFPVCVDGYEDKQLAQKEITRLRAFLYQCVSDFECCAVYPGWCTGYADYENSLREIDAAILKMRETVKNTPTWLQYNKGA